MNECYCVHVYRALSGYVTRPTSTSRGGPHEVRVQLFCFRNVGAYEHESPSRRCANQDLLGVPERRRLARLNKPPYAIQIPNQRTEEGTSLSVLKEKSNETARTIVESR